MADINDFNNGSGLGADGVSIFTKLFIGVPTVLIVVWSIWVFLKVFKGFVNGKLTLYELASVSTQAFAIAILMVLVMTN